MGGDFYGAAGILRLQYWDMGQFRLHGMHATLNARWNAASPPVATMRSGQCPRIERSPHGSWKRKGP